MRNNFRHSLSIFKLNFLFNYLIYFRLWISNKMVIPHHYYFLPLRATSINFRCAQSSCWGCWWRRWLKTWIPLKLGLCFNERTAQSSEEGQYWQRLFRFIVIMILSHIFIYFQVSMKLLKTDWDRFLKHFPNMLTVLVTYRASQLSTFTQQPIHVQTVNKEAAENVAARIAGTSDYNEMLASVFKKSTNITALLSLVTAIKIKRTSTHSKIPDVR